MIAWDTIGTIKRMRKNYKRGQVSSHLVTARKVDKKTYYVFVELSVERNTRKAKD